MADLTAEQLREVAQVADALAALEEGLQHVVLGSVEVTDGSGHRIGVLVGNDRGRLFDPIV